MMVTSSLTAVAAKAMDILLNCVERGHMRGGKGTVGDGDQLSVILRGGGVGSRRLGVGLRIGAHCKREVDT